jgi:hypothetical protein
MRLLRPKTFWVSKETLRIGEGYALSEQLAHKDREWPAIQSAEGIAHSAIGLRFRHHHLFTGVHVDDVDRFRPGLCAVDSLLDRALEPRQAEGLALS